MEEANRFMQDRLTIGVDIGGTRTKYGLVNMATGHVAETIIHQTEKKKQQRF